jgi:pimeloyl-ACP methyl ester carboxylesterase
MRPILRSFAILSLALLQPAYGEDAPKFLRFDHYVRVKAEVPAIAGDITQIYVREIEQTSGPHPVGPGADRVVLFVHGAGTPAEVAFDAAYRDYSWMAYLAQAGFDVFAMDLTGYGRSTRPAPMNDPCNLTAAQQAGFIPSLITAVCPPSYTKQLITIASDWNDIDSVVDHLRAIRQVDKVTLIGWSQGGPRAGGYATQHPDKVQKLVLLAPAYGRGASSNSPDPPAQVPADGAVFNTQSRAEFFENWDRQVGCPNQYDPAAANAVWSQMIESDPVGATWGPGVRRAPQETIWGWNQAMAAKLQIPVLLVSGAYDKQVAPAGVRTLYGDLGSTRKVFVDLACSSHNALWKKNHLLLFGASLEWLTKGTVDDRETGMLRRGY